MALLCRECRKVLAEDRMVSREDEKNKETAIKVKRGFMKKKNRLLALDVLRGITIAGMIMVNNPGSWAHIYAPLEHAEWNGLTPTDLVFPFFMFIMGVSTYFSLRKYDFTFTPQAGWKILRRMIVIFVIGLAINWFSIFCSNIFNIGSELSFGERLVKGLLPFDHIRILGVMQRLALCYGFAALIALFIKKTHVLYVAGGILIGYFILLLRGHGFELSEDNIIAVVDRTVLGPSHMYRMPVAGGGSILFDPEGLLSTIPCIAHVLLGFYAGWLITRTPENPVRVQQLFIFGTVLLFTGLLLSYGCPINKKIWSPTFVLVTCGFASQFLALLIWIIDIKGYVGWSRFFESFGINPLFIYVTAGFLAILIGNIRFYLEGNIVTVKGLIYTHLLAPWLPVDLSSLIYALLFVTLNWVIGHILYKKQIYINI